MIYIHGDTHGDIDLPQLKDFCKSTYLSEKDVIIILGDAGIVWSEEINYIIQYSILRATILFIDGNHENFEILSKFPEVKVFGAKAHLLDKNIYHIKRGEILSINGLSFLCIGGARSIDKDRRILNVSYWKEEDITSEDFENAYINLKKRKFEVDYVLTHCAPSSVVKNEMGFSTDSNTDLLERIKEITKSKHWYFGHYHMDETFKDGFRCFYHDTLEIKAPYEGKKDKVKSYFYTSNNKDTRNLRDINCRSAGFKGKDLPEWYLENSTGYHDDYYCLKGVTGIAYHPSFFENHIDKDSMIYLRYDENAPAPFISEDYINDYDEWPCQLWRCFLTRVISGLEKYSPEMNLTVIKAGINYSFDHYNNHEFNSNVYLRPYPEIKTPHYVHRYSREKAIYEVIYDGGVVGETFTLERARMLAYKCFDGIKKEDIETIENSYGGETMSDIAIRRSNVVIRKIEH